MINTIIHGHFYLPGTKDIQGMQEDYRQEIVPNISGKS